MFLTKLDLVADPQPDFWVVGSDLVWRDDVFGRLVVPVGTRTDLASIPRVLRNLPAFDPNGASRRPAVMHDYLYGSALGRRLGKSFADDFLRVSMKREGASPATAAAFYWAVRLFGGGPWREFEQQTQKRLD